MGEKFMRTSDMDYIPDTVDIIVGNTLYEVEDNVIRDSFELTGETAEELVASAREQADIEEDKPIVLDDEDLYNEDILGDTGKLVTAQEAYDQLDEQEKEDRDSFAEYCFDR